MTNIIKKFDEFNEAKDLNVDEAFKVEKYPELDKVVKEVQKEVIDSINKKVQNVKSKMPYKSQYVLENLIQLLEASV